jgi:hypothetical protein
MSIQSATHQRSYINPATWGLVVFWAFVESFLGGVLHALQVPLRGIVIAGAAVACLITIAAVSSGTLSRPTRFFSGELIRATLAVMAVKLILSPQAPPTAYVAMLFQGFTAYLFFGLIPSFRLAALFFSVLALLETAFQKVLVLLLFFGSDFWATFSNWINELHLQFAFLSISLQAIVIFYLVLYLLAGLLIGYWFGQWPERALSKKDELLKLFIAAAIPSSEPNTDRRFSKKNTWIILVLVLLLVGEVVMPSSVILITFFRVLIIGLLVYLLSPLLLRFLTKVLSKKIEQSMILRMIDAVGEQKKYFYFCWQLYQKKSILVRLLLSFESSLILSAAKSQPLSSSQPM